MYLYHSTSTSTAERIMLSGFMGRDFHGVAFGVFFADRPLDAADMVAKHTEQVIRVECKLSEAELACYELIEEGRPEEAYREWLLPEVLANSMPRELVEQTVA